MPPARRATRQAQWHSDATIYRDLIEMMLRFPKPLIAAVSGPAMAGGRAWCWPAISCWPPAKPSFGLPEPRRGLVAGMVAPLLAFRIGAGRAGYLLLSAQARSPPPKSIASACIMNSWHADHLWPRANELAGQCASLRAGSFAAHQADAQRNDRRESDHAAHRRRRRRAPRPAPPKRPPRVWRRFWKSASRNGPDRRAREVGRRSSANRLGFLPSAIAGGRQSIAQFEVYFFVAASRIGRRHAVGRLSRAGWIATARESRPTVMR